MKKIYYKFINKIRLDIFKVTRWFALKQGFKLESISPKAKFTCAVCRATNCDELHIHTLEETKVELNASL